LNKILFVNKFIKMKKFAISIWSILGVVSLTNAQNVGFGTNSPQAMIHVVSPIGEAARFDGASGMFLSFYEGGVYRGYLGSYSGSSTDMDFGTGVGNASGKIHFTTQTSPRLTIRENGFVGIGNTNPGYQMDVNGRIRLQAGTVNNVNTSAGTWHTDYRTNTDIAFIGMADSVNYGFWGSRPNVGWQFYFDARYGNVGIGRKPSSGATRLSLDHPSGASVGLYANGGYKGGMQATDSTLEIYSDYSGFCVGDCPPAGNIVFWPPPACVGIGCIGSATPGRIGMYNNSPKSRVHIVAGTGTSGVLISSSSAAVPASGYTLNVDGKIICEELKVQLSTSWPDYVFDARYNLKSLDELEAQVKKDGHLPGILSAAAVESDGGIEIGEMQRRMLEKIEELYLYVFELNKENKELKARLDKKGKRR
jgi:hypothetical protein